MSGPGQWLLLGATVFIYLAWHFLDALTTEFVVVSYLFIIAYAQAERLNR